VASAELDGQWFLKNAPPHPGPLPRFAAEREKPVGWSPGFWRQAAGRLVARGYFGAGLRDDDLGHTF